MEHSNWDKVPKVVMSEQITRRVITGDRAMVALIDLKSGAVVPEHKHVCEQLTYVLQGALKFKVEGQEVVVRQGQVLRVPGNVPHGAVAIEDTVNFEIFSPPREEWLPDRKG